MYLWKRKLGSEATYQKLINIFERANFYNYAEIVKNIACKYESEEDDSIASDYDEPIPQPETYPNVQLTPPPSPKHSRCTSSYCDEFLLVKPATANNLPKGDYVVYYKCNYKLI